MYNDELRVKLNELEELRNLKLFVKYGDKFKIFIKKGEYVVSKRKIKVSQQALLDFLEYQIKILKEEIEELKKGIMR